LVGTRAPKGDPKKRWPDCWSRNSLGICISPNPHLLHEVFEDRKKLKTPYGKLPQIKQYEYCKKILKHCYMFCFTPGTFLVGTWELNKSGNVHLHLIADDPKVTNEYELAVFRRDIENCTLVKMNRSKKKRK